MTDQPQTSMPAPGFAEPLGVYRPRAGAGQSGQAWMVTFTDLIALMLTFFVLVFSMSSLDEVRWQNLADSLAEGLDAVRDQKVPVPRETLNIERVTHLPGNNLEYLYSLLRDHMDSSPTLAGSTIVKEPSRLVLRFTAAEFFAQAAPETDESALPGPIMSADGKRLLFALSGLLQTVDHRVEVIGFTRPDGADSDGASWARATDLALRVAETLRDVGYQGRLQVLGARARQSLAEAGGARLEVVIQADRGEDAL